MCNIISQAIGVPPEVVASIVAIQAAVIAYLHTILSKEEEEEEFENLFLLIAGQKMITHIPKTENYFELIIPRFSLSDFKSHFRMSRTTFEELSLMIGPDLITEQSNVPVMKKLAIAIWIFGNQEVHRSVADRFGVSKSTSWQCMIDVATLLCRRSRTFIKWPTGQAIVENQLEFQEIAQFPGVIEAIDGCQIQISAPHENADSYMNRKGYYSINTQAICDHRMRFIDVYAGCCGSVNDARVWSLSDIKQEIIRDNARYFPDETHILGDKIYPLLFNLLTPYKDCGRLTRIQRNFNLVHARTRQTIERVFALLLSRFRRLKYLYLQNIEYASMIILACCCLHNICLSLNDLFDEGVAVDNNAAADDINNVPEAVHENVDNNDQELENIGFGGQMKREIIANVLYRREQHN
ncbi:putative nuclease HARBI1 [Leptopilina boulardi]|uniref:putative nuclease HARBI1 n=1 Tax=Leptopilina boulardi TaxID=63433 RepID=UPI0021F627F9|nr:putative nuclease HARBI1 [Leptopilina boulardi]